MTKFLTRYNFPDRKRRTAGLLIQCNYPVTPDVGLSTVAMARRAQNEGKLSQSGVVTWRERPASEPLSPAPAPAPEPALSPAPETSAQ